MHTRTILSAGTTTTLAAAAVTSGPATSLAIPAAEQASLVGTVTLPIPGPSGAPTPIPSAAASSDGEGGGSGGIGFWGGTATGAGSGGVLALTPVGKLFVPGSVLSSAGIGLLLVARRRRVG